jgi:phosphoribosylamine-glycine ligase
MKVLVLGSGGREHAFARRLARDTGVDEVMLGVGQGSDVGQATPAGGLHGSTLTPGSGRFVGALTVVGRGHTFEAATAVAYEAANEIRFEGMPYRRDIGRQAFGRPLTRSLIHPFTQ